MQQRKKALCAHSNKAVKEYFLENHETKFEIKINPDKFYSKHDF